MELTIIYVVVTMFVFGGPIPFLINKYKLNQYDEEEDYRKGEEKKGKCSRCIDYMEEKVFEFFVDEEKRNQESRELQVIIV